MHHFGRCHKIKKISHPAKVDKVRKSYVINNRGGSKLEEGEQLMVEARPFERRRNRWGIDRPRGAAMVAAMAGSPASG
jgi:hypothetical protein